jgi:cell volume regulation protein A
MGGSGFLAVFLTGVLMGNRRIVFQKGTYLFHDAIAWIGQILMFVMLGMLVTPSELLPVVGTGLLISAVLILVARPIAVIPLLLPFGFNVREIALVSWTGLKGSVPIILAMYPLLFGLPSGELLFNVVFFVVLVSAIVQGGTLSWVARRLGLEEEGVPEPPVTLEITSLRDVDADIVEYTVGADSRAADRRLSQLALPNGVVVAMIARENTLISPRGSTTIRAGDHVFTVLRPDLRPLVDRVFTRNPGGEEELPPLIEFQLRGEATVEDLADFYGISLDAHGSVTLDELIRERFGEGAFEDRVVNIDGVKLHIIEIVEGRIVTVGFAISPSEEEGGVSPIDRPANLV